MSHRRRRRPTPERSRHGDSGKLRRGGGASRFGAGPWAGLWAVRGSEGLGGGASSSRTRPSKWRLALSSGFRFRGGRPGDDRVTVGPGAPPPASLPLLTTRSLSCSPSSASPGTRLGPWLSSPPTFSVVTVVVVHTHLPRLRRGDLIAQSLKPPRAHTHRHTPCSSVTPPGTGPQAPPPGPCAPST